MLNRKLKTGDQMRAIQLEKDSGIEYYVRNTKEGYMHRTSEAIQGQYFIWGGIGVYNRKARVGDVFKYKEADEREKSYTEKESSYEEDEYLTISENHLAFPKFIDESYKILWGGYVEKQ